MSNLRVTFPGAKTETWNIDGENTTGQTLELDISKGDAALKININGAENKKFSSGDWATATMKVAAGGDQGKGKSLSVKRAGKK